MPLTMMNFGRSAEATLAAWPGVGPSGVASVAGNSGGDPGCDRSKIVKVRSDLDPIILVVEACAKELSHVHEMTGESCRCDHSRTHEVCPTSSTLSTLAVSIRRTGAPFLRF